MTKSSKDWAWGRDIGFADGLRAAGMEIMKAAQELFADGGSESEARRLRALAQALKKRSDEAEAEARKTHGYEVTR